MNTILKILMRSAIAYFVEQLPRIIKHISDLIQDLEDWWHRFMS